MKKNFKVMTVLASAALLLTACSSDKLEATSQAVNNPASADNSIQFGTYMGRSTRAYRGSYTGGQIANEANTDKYQTALTTTGFGVFSYFTGAANYRAADYTWDASGVWKHDNTNKYPNFMYNQKLTYDAAKFWVYSPVKYWPNGIDADNASNPSYTATQQAEGKLSFFAYAPFTTVEGSAYDGSTDGTAPDDVVAKKTGNENGITAMTTNESPTDVWVKYAMTNAAANVAV